MGVNACLGPVPLLGLVGSAPARVPQCAWRCCGRASRRKQSCILSLFHPPRRPDPTAGTRDARMRVSAGSRHGVRGVAATAGRDGPGKAPGVRVCESRLFPVSRRGACRVSGRPAGRSRRGWRRAEGGEAWQGRGCRAAACPGAWGAGGTAAGRHSLPLISWLIRRRAAGHGAAPYRLGTGRAVFLFKLAVPSTVHGGCV